MQAQEFQVIFSHEWTSPHNEIVSAADMTKELTATQRQQIRHGDVGIPVDLNENGQIYETEGIFIWDSDEKHFQELERKDWDDGVVPKKFQFPLLYYASVGVPIYFNLSDKRRDLLDSLCTHYLECFKRYSTCSIYDGVVISWGEDTTLKEARSVIKNNGWVVMCWCDANIPCLPPIWSYYK